MCIVTGVAGYGSESEDEATSKAGSDVEDGGYDSDAELMESIRQRRSAFERKMRDAIQVQAQLRAAEQESPDEELAQRDKKEKRGSEDIVYRTKYFGYLAMQLIPPPPPVSSSVTFSIHVESICRVFQFLFFTLHSYYPICTLYFD